MKKVLGLVLLLGIGIAVPPLHAQRLMTGERAPDLRVKEWLTPNRPTEGHARLVEFYHTSSQASNDRLAILDQLAERYAGRLDVIVIAKESAERVAAVVKPGNRRFCVAIDDGGRTFRAYGVQYVPFGVLTDARGKVVRMGNSVSPD